VGHSTQKHNAPITRLKTGKSQENIHNNTDMHRVTRGNA